MAFNELGFLFIFFPIALILYHVLPKVCKNAVLVILSLVFFAWGSTRYVILLVLSIVFNYISGLQIDSFKKDEKPGMAKMVLWSAVAVNLLLLGFFKYWGFVIDNVNAILGTNLSVPQTGMPLGVSFFTFSILSFLFDVYRDKAEVSKNPLDFALFVSFFPKLVSGPIVSYGEFAQQLHDRQVNLVKIGAGSRLFLIGLAKKVLLSNIIGNTFNAVSALPLDGVSVVSAWLGAISYTLMLYFDFSGYSDMAIGLAQMFGFSFNKNFDYPYMANSITDFWRRWHISLGAWFREYLYFPLGGSRVDTWKIVRNLLIVWLATGIWHGANWTFIVWGLYHGALQLLEKFPLKKILEKIPNAVKIPLTFLAVVIGWVFFFAPDLGYAFTWLGRMVGVGTVFADAAAKYYLGGSWLVLLIGFVAAYPLPARLAGGLYRQRSSLPMLVSVLWFALLLVLCIAGMTSSTYSSFLYFQF